MEKIGQWYRLISSSGRNKMLRSLHGVSQAPHVNTLGESPKPAAGIRICPVGSDGLAGQLVLRTTVSTNSDKIGSFSERMIARG